MSDGKRKDATSGTVNAIQFGDDHYANHLSRVNETREVVSTADILNERGVLVMKAGARLDKSAYEKIKKHQLTQSLASQISVSGTLNRDALGDEFRRLLGKYLDLQLIAEHHRLRSEIDAIVRSYALSPIAAQKLTIYQSQYPASFDGVLFGAWIAAMIAKLYGCSLSEVSDVFVAGLCRDLGLLHIDPAIALKTEALTPAEWRAIQSHPIIGKMILQNSPSIEPPVLRAILEHHERRFGLGYPAGLSGDEISLPGRIVGLADTIQAIRIGRFEKEGRNLADIMPILSINAHNFGDDLHRTVIAMLRESGVISTHTDSVQRDKDAVLSRVKTGWDRIAKVGSFIETLVAVLERIDEGAASARAKAITTQLATVITRSGMLSDEIGAWLVECQGRDLNAEEYSVIGEMELMLNDFHWQLQDARKSYDQLFSSVESNSSPALIAVRKMAEELSMALNETT